MISKTPEGLPLYSFDRSRLETCAECQRKYYWLYGFMGIGITKLKDIPPYWPYITGRYIHEGVELIVQGGDYWQSAKTAGDNYEKEILPLITAPDIQPEQLALLTMELTQQVDLVKALVYGFGMASWPRLQRDYEFEPENIEREEEVRWVLGQEGEQQVVMRLLTRTDLLGKVKADGRMININLKSVSEPSAKWRGSFDKDMQTLTEAVAIEARLGVEIAGVVIEGLVKGKKSEWPKDSGFWQHSNELIYVWTKVNESPLPGEEPYSYAPSWNWTCTGRHKMGNGQICPGNKDHTLGKGWRKLRADEVYPGGLKGWIDFLFSTNPAFLNEYFVSLPPIKRDPYQVERWKRQVLYAEKGRQDNAAVVDKLFLEQGKQAGFEYLDYTFPMNAGYDCNSCSYHDICWGSGDPFDETVWRARVPNHPAEVLGLVQIEGAS